jgi:hypothetical protein
MGSSQSSICKTDTDLAKCKAEVDNARLAPDANGVQSKGLFGGGKRRKSSTKATRRQTTKRKATRRRNK